jgi:NADPH:quinone reductase-like Zn-dependent oxidoreductase
MSTPETTLATKPNVPPATMRGVAIDGFGGPEKLKLRDLPVPDLGPGEVLIRVAVAGIGVWDAAEREGELVGAVPGATSKFPLVPGADGTGTVVALGPGVTEFREGDEVYAYGFLNPKGGFYAEYAAVPADQVARVPESLDLETAVALPVTGVTALRGLDDTLRIGPGVRLLVFGAAGGVGYPAVQLAKAMGAHVLAVVSNGEAAALVRGAGADVVVNGREDDLAGAIRAFAPDGLDALLAVVNGHGLDTAIAAVRQGGRVAYPHGVQPAPEGWAGVEAVGYDGTPGRAVFDKLNALVESRPFHVHISGRFPLADAAQAHRALEDHHQGRIVLVV